MALFDQLKQLLADPPPEFAFELSEAGIAWTGPAAKGAARRVQFEPLEPGILSVSPLRDNVLNSEVLAAKVRAIVGASPRKKREAAIILPDYCARVAVLEFDAFPKDPAEQQSLVRFRLKRTLPFDIDGAAVSFFPQVASTGKGFEVVVVAAALEIVARYEAPFRAAGLHPGFVTTSSLAAADLDRGAGVHLMAKLSGRAITITALRDGVIKLVRCVEVPEITYDDVTSVLFPTVAFVEDEEGVRPERISVCGFEPIGERHRDHWQQELGIRVEPIHSSTVRAEAHNAGLLGYLESFSKGAGQSELQPAALPPKQGAAA
jgi:type IV pilus assembly protein PilM